MLVRATAALVVMFALVGAATGCNAVGADDSSVAVTVDSSRGYPIVRSSGDPTAWTAELVATMGIDSAGESTFGTVRSVLLDSSGAGDTLGVPTGTGTAGGAQSRPPTNPPPTR